MNITFELSENLQWARDTAVLSGWTFQALTPTEEFVETEPGSGLYSRQIVQTVSHNIVFDERGKILQEAQASLTPEQRTSGNWIIFENDTNIVTQLLQLFVQ